MGTSAQPKRFPQTRWTLIRRARNIDADARAALSELCGAYWYPLYAFVRRRGRLSNDDAADLTQAFFARVLEKRDLDSVDPAYGRFSSWLLASMTHFLENHWDKERAKKRGGGAVPVPIDTAAADAAWLRETTNHLTPEKQYERLVTLRMIDRVTERLGAEYAARNQTPRFEALRGALTGDNIERYAEIGRLLSLSEGGVKKAVSDLRRRRERLMREEVAQLVDEGEDVRRELERMLETLE